MSLIHIARHHQTLGSFSEAEVKEGIASQRFFKDDLAWRSGMKEWRPLSEMSTLWESNPSANILISDVITSSSLGTIWERRSEIGFFKALLKTIAAVLIHPSSFFSTMKPDGGIKGPLFYYLIISGVSIFAAVLQRSFLLVLQLIPFFSSSQLATTSYKKIIFGVLLLLLGAVVIVLLVAGFLSLMIFLWSLLQHVSLKVVGGAKESWKATFRGICYVGGSIIVVKGFFSLSASVPMIRIGGAIVVGVWVIFLTFVALKRIHHITSWRLLLAMIVPILLFIIPTMLVVEQALQRGYNQQTLKKEASAVPPATALDTPSNEPEDNNKDLNSDGNKLLEEAFYHQWEQPADLSSEEKKTLAAALEVTIEPNGTISHYALTEPSGNAAMDASITAVAEKLKIGEALPAVKEQYTTTLVIQAK